MIRCPQCQSPRVLVVLSVRQARCIRCGAVWLQDGPYQAKIRPGGEVVPREAQTVS